MAGANPTVDTVTDRAEMPNPCGRRGDDALHRGEHAVVVGQRLAHAHEDDVGQPAVIALAHLRRAARTCSRISAVDRLRVQPALARRTERARHAASRLRRDAHGVALRIAHQHRLERRAVDRTPQRLSGLPRVALDFAHGIQQLREQRVGDLAAHRRRQVGHQCGVGDQPAEVLVGQLLGAKRRQPQLGDRRGTVVSSRSAKCRGGMARRGASNTRAGRG